MVSLLVKLCTVVMLFGCTVGPNRLCVESRSIENDSHEDGNYYAGSPAYNNPPPYSDYYGDYDAPVYNYQPSLYRLPETYYDAPYRRYRKIPGRGVPMVIDTGKRCAKKVSGVLGISGNRKEYIVCTPHSIIYAKCKYGHLFNPYYRCCVHHSIPVVSPACPEGQGIYPVYDNCTLYKICGPKLTPKIYSCPAGNIYSPTSKRCVPGTGCTPTIIYPGGAYEGNGSEEQKFPPCMKSGVFNTSDPTYYYKCTYQSDGAFLQTRYKCPNGTSFKVEYGLCVPNNVNETSTQPPNNTYYSNYSTGYAIVNQYKNPEAIDTEPPTKEPAEPTVMAPIAPEVRQLQISQTKTPTTEGPTEGPTEESTEKSTEVPTEVPTEGPTEELTEDPTEEPTEELTEDSTEDLTEEPTEKPTEAPPQTIGITQASQQVIFQREALGTDVTLDNPTNSTTAPPNTTHTTTTMAPSTLTPTMSNCTQAGSNSTSITKITLTLYGPATVTVVAAQSSGNRTGYELTASQS